LPDTHFHEQGLGLFPVAQNRLDDTKGRPLALAGKAVRDAGLLVKTEGITRFAGNARTSEVMPLGS
jgi:hypothetical protein